MPNYRRFYIPNHSIFLTVVTRDRRPWLADDVCVETLLSSMRWARTKYPFRHIAHVVLHDHIHWMFHPDAGTSYSCLVAAMKRDVTWRLKEAGIQGPLWQKRFYDHVIRDDEDFGRHLDYVHFNPVKHGYATLPADYRRSSFAEWLRKGVYSEDWGVTQPDWIKDMELE